MANVGFAFEYLKGSRKVHFASATDDLSRHQIISMNHLSTFKHTDLERSEQRMGDQKTVIETELRKPVPVIFLMKRYDWAPPSARFRPVTLRIFAWLTEQHSVDV